MCICDLKLGEIGIINDIQCNSKLAKRLSVLGFTVGTEIKLKRIAPLGDPLVLNLRGFDVAIRKTDARNIFLER